jgi:hypothetical protein
VCRCRSQLTNLEVLVSHRNAPLTPTGRLLLCQRIESGWAIAHAADAMGGLGTSATGR